MDNQRQVDPKPQRTLLVRPGLDGVGTRKALEAIARHLGQVPESEWNAHALGVSVRQNIEASAFPRHAVEESLAVALTGLADVSTLYLSLAAIGKRVAERRLRRAVLELSVIA